MYRAGGNSDEARHQAETDFRNARDKTADQTKRIGDKVDKAYDDTKSQVEARYKTVKEDLQKDKNKVEVIPKPPPTPPTILILQRPASRAGKGAEEGGRWYGAFGGFGGLGLRVFD